MMARLSGVTFLPTKDVRLIHGDCLVELERITSRSVNMVLADPPYGITACKWDNVIPLEPLWCQLKRIIKTHGAIVLTSSQPFTSSLIVSNIDDFKHEWIWRKNRGSNFAGLRFGPFKEHENIVVFCDGTPNYHPIMQKRSAAGQVRASHSFDDRGGGEAMREKLQGKGQRVMLNKSLRNPSSVQQFNVEVGQHPTQKPVALLEYLIRTYTNEGEIILDFCMGSGTTGVAAVNLGRSFIGIELDVAYFKLAEKRVAEALRGGLTR